MRRNQETLPRTGRPRGSHAHAPADDDPVGIGPGTEDDLPAIVDILNYTIVSSDATFISQPVTLAERREWFGRFSGTGPYRLFAGP